MNPASPNPTTSIGASLTSPLAGTQADKQRDRVCPTAAPPVSAGELDRPSASRVSRSSCSSCLVATVGWAGCEPKRFTVRTSSEAGCGVQFGGPNSPNCHPEWRVRP
jgi:hypothetical protein